MDELQPSMVSVPIVITMTGISRNRVDPATWNAIAKVGTFVNVNEKSGLRVEIDCLVANPADQYHAEQTVHR